jgi:long-chain acyl-CoA synthetase
MTPSWHALRKPQAPAIVMGSSGETVTYAELDDRSRRLASALRGQGIASGDHIAILMENHARYLEVSWAAQRSGLYYTAINSHLRQAEIQYILDDCGAVALITSESMADVVAGLDLSRMSVRIAAAGRVRGFQDYGEVISRSDGSGLGPEQEGREML